MSEKHSNVHIKCVQRKCVTHTRIYTHQDISDDRMDESSRSDRVSESDARPYYSTRSLTVKIQKGPWQISLMM